MSVVYDYFIGQRAIVDHLQFRPRCFSPLVCLAALVKACGASGWNISSEIQYWIVCVTVFVWGIFGLSVIVKDVVKQEKVRE